MGRTLIRMRSAGPHWVRTASVAWGSRRARAVTTGIKKPQVVASSRPEPRPQEQDGGGFESHLTSAAGWWALPTSRRHRRRTSRSGRAGAIAAWPEPCSSSPAVPPTCPKHRSAAVANGQQRSVAVASNLCHRLSLGGRTVLPKLPVRPSRPTGRPMLGRADSMDPARAVAGPSVRGCPHGMSARTSIGQGIHPPIQVSVRT